MRTGCTPRCRPIPPPDSPGSNPPLLSAAYLEEEAQKPEQRARCSELPWGCRRSGFRTSTAGCGTPNPPGCEPEHGKTSGLPPSLPFQKPLVSRTSACTARSRRPWPQTPLTSAAPPSPLQEDRKVEKTASFQMGPGCACFSSGPQNKAGAPLPGIPPQCTPAGPVPVLVNEQGHARGAGLTHWQAWLHPLGSRAPPLRPAGVFPLGGVGSSTVRPARSTCAVRLDLVSWTAQTTLSSAACADPGPSGMAHAGLELCVQQGVITFRSPAG